jgi:hypothetical protein
MARKTPQQKKRESYAKDRRNVYGERGSHSRFSVARRKRNRRSRERAAARQATETAVRDPDRAERLEGKAVVKHGGRWRKIADEPLGEVLERKLGRRVRAGSMPETAAEAKASRIRRRSRTRQQSQRE